MAIAIERLASKSRPRHSAPVALPSLARRTVNSGPIRARLESLPAGERARVEAALDAFGTDAALQGAWSASLRWRERYLELNGVRLSYFDDHEPQVFAFGEAADMALLDPGAWWPEEGALPADDHAADALRLVQRALAGGDTPRSDPDGIFAIAGRHGGGLWVELLLLQIRSARPAALRASVNAASSYGYGTATREAVTLEAPANTYSGMSEIKAVIASRLAGEGGLDERALGKAARALCAFPGAALALVDAIVAEGDAVHIGATLFERISSPHALSLVTRRFVLGTKYRAATPLHRVRFVALTQTN